MSSEYAVRFQEMIAKMPNTLTVKEVDEFCKNAKKEIKVKIGEETKVKKTAVQKKRAKKVDVDEEGNEIEKVKKPLNAYQQFIKDNRQKVKDEHPDAKGDEIFTMIATLWNKHKEDMKNNVGDDDSDNDNKSAVSAVVAAVVTIDNEDDGGDIKRDNEDDKKKVKKDKKEKKEKKEKKGKKSEESSD